jgi:hypothetical protein
MNFLKWYKNIVDSADQEPPASVWDGIQEDLDIDAVWRSINDELHKSSRQRFIYRVSAAASILLIIAAGTLFFTNYNNKEALYPAIQRDAVSILPEIPEDGPFVDFEPAVTARYSRLPAHVTTTNIPVREGKPATGRPGRGETLTEMSGLICMYVTAGMGISNEKSTAGEDDPAGRNSSGLTGFYAGLSGHVGNTWLLNNKTIEGLRSDALTAAMPSFGYSFGILAGKKINDSFDIQAEAFFISRSSQNYNEYLHGKYIYNNYQFNYSSLTLSGRWYINWKTRRKHAITLGAYAGLLRNAIQDLNGESLSLKQDYNRADYGILTGYEFIQQIDNRISLGTGIQARAGLNNIFAGNDLIPDYLNTTHNFSINLVVSLKYNLK